MTRGRPPLSKAGTVAVTVRLPAETVQELDALARYRGIRRAELLRELLLPGILDAVMDASAEASADAAWEERD